MSTAVAPAPDKREIDRWEPIVLTFDYKWKGCGPCSEPCLCPCCCCQCGCFSPMSPCMSQRDKAVRSHKMVHARYTREGVYGPGKGAVSFVWEETDYGIKMVEIFRNADAAEEYYTHFMKDKCFVIKMLVNLPFRQAKGPSANHADGNVGGWVTVPEGKKLEDVCAIGKQLDQYNHLTGKDKIPVHEWTTAPSKEELERLFGKFHFGFVKESTLAVTDTGGKPGDAPPPKPPTQQVMSSSGVINVVSATA